jgi:fatty acid synthase subunit beta
MLNQSHLFADSVLFAPNWEIDYAPRIAKLPNGSLMLDTKFSRLIGKPPLMVAGMTPTTANEQIVAAFTNAGYHGEFAGYG